MKQLFFRANPTHTFKIIRTVKKIELPSSNLIKQLRKKYKQTNKDGKLNLFIQALKENRYKFIYEQSAYVVIQEPNIYYSPIGVFLDICSHITGWHISEVIDQSWQWVFPKWGNKYKEFNYKDGDHTDIRYAVYTVIEDEIGLKRMSIANMNFLGTRNKMNYYQLGQALKDSKKRNT